MQTVDEIRLERLLMLISEHRTQAKLAKVINKSPAQISQWVNKSPNSKSGKPRVMDGTTARDIEKACGKPVGWMDQPVPHHRSESESTHLPPEVEGEPRRTVTNFTPSFSGSAFNTYRAPVVSWGRMGVDVLSRENSTDGELVAPVDFGEGAVVWRVEDDSMSPDYNQGDYIAIDSNPSALEELAAGEAVIVETSGGTKILRYYTPLADGHFEARPPASSRYGALSTLQMQLHVRAVVQAHLRIRRQAPTR